jgi:putative transposase
MIRLQAYKFELKPDGEQLRGMRRFAGSCRFVYNKALAMQKENHETGNKFIGYAVLCKTLTEWRNSQETPWLKDAPCHPLQQALKDLEKAYKNFFAKRASFPRFKRKGTGDAFRYPDPKQIKLDQANNRLFLPKLGWLRYRNSRDVLGDLRNVTVSEAGGKWFASIQTQREVEQPLPTATSAVGIDVGIARFATLSDNTYIAPLNSFKKHQQRLARYQRRMSRKVKFSKNWKKAKARVQRIHTTIANARKDFLHKVTTTICQNHALVCIEDVQVRNMSRSSKGNSAARQDATPKGRPEPRHSRSGLGRISAAARLQDGMERRHAAGRTAPQHQPHVPLLCSCIERKSTYAGEVPLHRMWLRKSRRCRGRDQRVRAGIPLVSLWSAGAVRPREEAGTHRSDRAKDLRSAVGIPFLQGSFREGRISM